MMKLRKITTLLAGALLFFYSCDLAMDNTDNGTDEPVAIEMGEAGNLSITVPLISSALQETLESGIISRAYLFAKQVEIVLLDGTGSEVDRRVMEMPGGSLDEPGAQLTAEMDVPWGLDYRILVRILEEAPSTEVLVEGESASFDMSFSQVDVSVALVPSSPTSLTAGDTISSSLTGSVYDDGAASFSSMGGEIWFSHTPAGDQTAVLTVDTSGEALLFHADSEGNFQENTGRHHPEQPTILIRSFAAGTTSYTGMIILNDSGAETEYTLTNQIIAEGYALVDLSGLSGEEGSSLMVELIPSGSTDSAVSLSGEITGDSLYLLNSDNRTLWEGTGTYDCTYVIDRDSSGDASENDLVLTETVTLAAGENTLSPALSDFALHSPDISGTWYCLNDETAISANSKVMEFMAEINEDGTFTIYGRRHDNPGDLWYSLDEDAFLPLLQGSFVLDGYDLTASITSIDLLTMHLLADDNISGNGIGLSENEISTMFGLALGSDLSPYLTLMSRNEVETHLSSYLTNPLAIAIMFMDQTGTVSESTAQTQDGEDVSVLAISGYEYFIKSTSSATDMAGDDEGFRAPLP